MPTSHHNIFTLKTFLIVGVKTSVYICTDCILNNVPDDQSETNFAVQVVVNICGSAVTYEEITFRKALKDFHIQVYVYAWQGFLLRLQTNSLSKAHSD